MNTDCSFLTFFLSFFKLKELKHDIKKKKCYLAVEMSAMFQFTFRLPLKGMTFTHNNSLVFISGW